MSMLDVSGGRLPMLGLTDEVSRRYLPAIGRFLIIVTFLEDALRIITQWSDQLVYLREYRHSTSRALPHQPRDSHPSRSITN